MASSDESSGILIPQSDCIWSPDSSVAVADFGFLDEFLAGARVVALGEPTHGAREVFQIKAQIARYLVENHGFTILALEANLTEARTVDRYVKGDGDDGRAALSELFGIWNTSEVLELVEWLRHHNEQAVEPVSLEGIDVQSPWSAAGEVLSFLESADPAFYGMARELYAPALVLEHIWSPAGLASVAPLLLRDSRRVLEHLEGLVDGSHAVRGVEAAWALRNAYAVVQLAQSSYGNLPSRDQSMADNLLRLLEEDPGARVVLWAHNAHIIEAEPSWYRSASMGNHLASALGDSYRSIGIIFGQGESRAFEPSTGDWVSHRLPLVPHTLGGKLHRLGLPVLFVNLLCLPYGTGMSWLAEPMTLRWAGAAARSTDYYLVPNEAFDALFFIDTISPAEGLTVR